MEENVRKYRENLEKEIKDLKEERKRLVDKVKNGEKLTIKENLTITKLKDKIDELEENLKSFQNLDLLNEIEATLVVISNNKTTKKDKDALIAKIISQLKKLDKQNLDTLQKELEIDIKNSKDLDKLKNELNVEINDLKVVINYLKENNKNVNEIENEIEKKEEILTTIKNYEDNKINIEVFEKDLNKLADKKVTKAEKEKIIQKLNEILNKTKEKELEKIDELLAMDADYEKVNEKSLKERTKEKLTALGDKLKNSRAVKVIGIGIVIVAIIATAKSCSKDNQKHPTQPTPTKPGHSDTQTAPLYPGTPGTQDRVDAILKSGFFKDTTTEEIEGIIDAIDNKTLMNGENANYASSIVTGFNEITENYLFETVTKADEDKIDILKSFAIEDSDLDKFLHGYSDIVKGILSNPTNENLKEDAYNYIATFALSLNGFTNTSDEINYKNAGENAVVDDYRNWFTAYNYVVKPTFPIVASEQNFEKWHRLQNVAETALEGPEFAQICETQKTLKR